MSSAAVVLFFIFLVLKLTGIIAWSWWWVTSPLWIALAIGLFLITVMSYVSRSIKKASGWRL